MPAVEKKGLYVEYRRMRCPGVLKHSNRRDTQYGHKLNITTGTRGTVLDVVVEEGNPADSSRLLPR